MHGRCTHKKQRCGQQWTRRTQDGEPCAQSNKERERWSGWKGKRWRDQGREGEHGQQTHEQVDKPDGAAIRMERQQQLRDRAGGDRADVHGCVGVS
ncbi:hypothetical protein BC831DRAFT_446090 [Entophlyctis helioformis]|nr:hypothetical protein BC831DRAFT_446090 [Entophlyctis helioformis]